MTRLIVRDLGKQFGAQLLFEQLSFTIEGGAVLGVTGPNGSGKSTLLRILAGIIPPNAGDVTLQFQGRSIPTEERPLHTGFVAPYLRMYDAFTARENLRFQLQARGRTGAGKRIAEVLERVNLLARADDRVGTYSSGMYQRLRLASALLVEPQLLLLDEPFSNLDEAGRRLVDRVMTEQRSRGVLQIMATNTARYTDRCDRVVSVEEYK